MRRFEKVRMLLAGHRPADGREAESLKRISELIDSAAEPFSRRTFQPGHLTASAIVVDPDFTSTLLVHHAWLLRWLQPGGHFEPGEDDPSAAAAREVLEETGLVSRWPGARPLLLDVDVHDIPQRREDPAHCHFDLRMLVIADAGTARSGKGVTEARWVRPAEFRALDLDPGILRALGKLEFRG